MKKIITALLLFLAIGINAQTYKIASKLKLVTVNQGAPSDSILVRGSDEIVKYVPRSSFSGAQNLNDVLINGNSSSQSIFINDSDNSTTVGVSAARIIGSNLNGQNNLILTDRNESGDVNYSFDPDKSSGDYILATLDDVMGVQSISGEIVNNDDPLNPVITTPTLTQILTADNLTNKAIRMRDRFNATELYLNGNGWVLNSLVNIEIGSFDLEQDEAGGKFTKSNNGNSTLNFIIPNGLESSNTSFILPADKPSGDYIVATLDDISSIDPPTLQSVIEAGNSYYGIRFYPTNEGYSSSLNILPNELEFSYSGDEFTGFTSTRLGSFSTSFTHNGVAKIAQLSATEGLLLQTSGSMGNPTAKLRSDLLTVDRVYQFPDASGEIALKSDIPKIGTVAPTSATDTGIVGEIRVSAGFIYWCVATNTWIRALGTTW